MVCRSCSEVACGLCRRVPHGLDTQKGELSKIVLRGRKKSDICMHKSNRVELGNIQYAPKQILGNSDIRMTTPGSGSNTPRFISVPFLRGRDCHQPGLCRISWNTCSDGAGFTAPRRLRTHARKHLITSSNRFQTVYVAEQD